MKSLGKAMLSFVIVGLMSIAVSLLSTRPVEATNPQQVTVANTPLPVQGTISVGNTPSVNVANSPTVNLGNTTLKVNNALDSNNKAIPLVVSPQAPQPFQDQCDIGAQNICYFHPPPTGMRMIIQEFDFEANLSTGSVLVFLVTTLNSASQGHIFPTTLVDSNNNLFATHQPTTLYHDATVAPECTTSSGAITSGQCEISGYFVPLQ